MELDVGQQPNRTLQLRCRPVEPVRTRVSSHHRAADQRQRARRRGAGTGCDGAIAQEGKIIAAGGFDPNSAEAIVEKGDADLVAFGRHFLANPDLPKRIKLGLPLNAYDRATFYTFDFHGYTD